VKSSPAKNFFHELKKESKVKRGHREKRKKGLPLKQQVKGEVEGGREGG